MADNNTIGTAYVQIVPSAEGIQGSITNLLGGEAKSAGESSGASLGSSLVGTVKKIIAVAGFGAAIKEAFSSGADYEQLTGGIETLFKDSSNAVMKYAQDAYKNVGMSANDYMETTTSFAASMLKSVGGDTDKAAEQANKAITQMSDNANKMGTDMESIENAYKGFAKSNYTMLDNLSLGYSGSKEGMESLLADAQAISGVEYDISSYSDIVDAIGVIQDEMGITGTTAKEAASTFSGSMASMKAAAENVLTAISTGENLSESLDALLESTCTFVFDNAIPMFGTMISEIVTTLIPWLLEAGTDAMNNLADGLADGLPGINSEALEMVDEFIGTVKKDLPLFLQAGLNLLKTLASGIVKALPSVGNAALQGLAKFTATVASHLPEILQTGMTLLGKLIAGIISAIPKIPGAVKQVIASAKNAFEGYDWGSIGRNIIEGVKKGLTSAASSIASAAKEAAKSALNAAKDFLGIHSPSTVFRDQIGKNIALGLAEGISGNTSAVKKAMDAMSETSVGRINTEISTSFSDNTQKANNQMIRKMDQMIKAIESDRTIKISKRDFREVVPVG